MDGDHLAIALATLGRQFNGALSIEILSSERVGSEHLLRRAFKDLFPTLASGFRTDVHDPVSSAHHILVVLYYDDGIALIAQFLERVDEPFVIALMKTYTWLVKDIENIDELRAYLCGQPYALTLTAGE